MKTRFQFLNLLKSKTFVIGISVIIFSFLLYIGVNKYDAYQKKVTYESMVKAAVTKQQALEKFAAKLASYTNKQDWADLYKEGKSPTFKGYVTEEEFTIATSKALVNYFSLQISVKEANVQKDTGLVKEIAIGCTTKKCTGNNRIETPFTLQYQYKDGQWTVPDDKKPSEKALADAIYVYTNVNDVTKQSLMDYFGGGYNSVSYTLAQNALWLDENPANRALGDRFIKILKDTIAARATPVPISSSQGTQNSSGSQYNPPVVYQPPVQYQPIVLPTIDYTPPYIPPPLPPLQIQMPQYHSYSTDCVPNPLGGTVSCYTSGY